MASEAVKKIIDELKVNYPEAGYRFAHIALGDGNLGDCDLAFCIEPARVFDWIKQKLIGKDIKHCNPTVEENWQRCEFDDILNEAEAIMTAVIKIQEIPKDER